MFNPFFSNHGPLKIFDIFTLLDLKPDKKISDKNFKRYNVDRNLFNNLKQEFRDRIIFY